MGKIIKIFSGLILLLLIACQNQGSHTYEYYPKNSKDYPKRAELKFRGNLTLKIDSLFNIDQLKSIKLIKHQGKDFLYILNGKNIYKYDINGVKKGMIELKEEGPNSVGPFSSFDGLGIVNPDSLLFLNHSTGILYLIDGGGNVQNKIDLSIHLNNGAVYSTNLSSINCINNSIYIPTSGFQNTEDFTEFPTCLVVNLTSFQFIDGIFIYPEIYNTAYWGYHTFLRMSSYSYNESQFFVSYAIDPNIYIFNGGYSLEGTRYLSSEFFGAIYPQDEDYKRRFKLEGRNDPGHSEYFFEVSFFIGSHFLEGTKYYLRFVRIGGKGSPQDPAQKVKFSIIISNEQLEKAGEFVIPEKYSYDIVFFSEEKIYFLNYDLYDEKERNLVFDEYEISPVPHPQQ